MTKKSRDRRKALRKDKHGDRYLNSLIEKATPALKNVDVDRFMDDIR